MKNEWKCTEEGTQQFIAREVGNELLRSFFCGNELTRGPRSPDHEDANIQLTTFY